MEAFIKYLQPIEYDAATSENLSPYALIGYYDANGTKDDYMNSTNIVDVKDSDVGNINMVLIRKGMTSSAASNVNVTTKASITTISNKNIIPVNTVIIGDAAYSINYANNSAN